jgi:hypothetical protein
MGCYGTKLARNLMPDGVTDFREELSDGHHCYQFQDFLTEKQCQIVKKNSWNGCRTKTTCNMTVDCFCVTDKKWSRTSKTDL